MSQAWTHGLVQIAKYGTEQRDGLEICLGRGLPTPDSVRSRAPNAPRPPTPSLEKARAARERGNQFFVPTGQSTRARMLSSGESVAVSGVTVGIYLFRAATP